MADTDHQQLGAGSLFAASQDRAMGISPSGSWYSKNDGGETEHHGLHKIKQTVQQPKNHSQSVKKKIVRLVIMKVVVNKSQKGTLPFHFPFYSEVQDREFTSK